MTDILIKSAVTIGPVISNTSSLVQTFLFAFPFWLVMVDFIFAVLTPRIIAFEVTWTSANGSKFDWSGSI
jgi:hypothetical protein